MKAKLSTEHDQQLEVIEASRWLAAIPGAADVDDQRTGWLERTKKFHPEWTKPFDVLFGIHISILFFPNQTEGWTGQYEIDRFIGYL